MMFVELREIMQQRFQTCCLLGADSARLKPPATDRIHFIMGLIRALMICFKLVDLRERLLHTVVFDCAQARKQRLLFIGSMPRPALPKIAERSFQCYAGTRIERLLSNFGQSHQVLQEELNALVTVAEHAERFREVALGLCSDL